MLRSTRSLFCAPRAIVANHAKITITTGRQQRLRLGQKAQSKTVRRRITPYLSRLADRATAPAAEPPPIPNDQSVHARHISLARGREKGRRCDTGLLLGILSDNVVKRSCLPILRRQNPVSLKPDGERPITAADSTSEVSNVLANLAQRFFIWSRGRPIHNALDLF